MKIDERIFNELQDAHHLPNFLDEILPDLQAKENGYQNFADAEQSLSDQPDELDSVLDTDIINAWYLPGNSLLLAFLIKYYHGMDSLLAHVRSAIEIDDHGLVFVSGAGYDIISGDLLDSTPDGQAKIDFLNWINDQFKPHTVFTVLQTDADPELDPAILETAFTNYSDAVSAAKEAITDSQADYEPDKTEIITNKTVKGDITSFELWTAGQDHWLASVEICVSTLK